MPRVSIETSTVMDIFQQNKNRNMKFCQDIEKMVLEQLFLLDIMKLPFSL